MEQLSYTEHMIDLLQQDWDKELDLAKRSKKSLSRRDKQAREEAVKEIARIKRERRERLEAYKRQRSHWKKVIRELDEG